MTNSEKNPEGWGKKARQPAPFPTHKQSTKNQFEQTLLLLNLLKKLDEDQQSTKEILKRILQKLEQIEHKLNMSSTEEAFLPPQDKEIYEYIKMKGYADAEEIKEYMGYKGKNAASARLNRLVEKGILEKTRVGKRVLFKIKTK